LLSCIGVIILVVLVWIYSIKRRRPGHLQRRQTYIFRDLVNIFHSEQLLIVRRDWLGLGGGCLIESGSKGVFAVGSLYRSR